MEIFLQELKRFYPNEYIRIFFDEAPGPSLQRLRAPENMVIEKVLAYSPETIRAENI